MSNQSGSRALPVTQPVHFRLLTICILAGIIGILAGIAAEVLDRLIGLVINLAFYQRLSTDLVPIGGNTVGPLAIIIPAIGGLIVGLVGRPGSKLGRRPRNPSAKETGLVKRRRRPPQNAPP